MIDTGIRVIVVCKDFNSLRHVYKKICQEKKELIRRQHLWSSFGFDIDMLDGSKIEGIMLKEDSRVYYANRFYIQDGISEEWQNQHLSAVGVDFVPFKLDL